MDCSMPGFLVLQCLSAFTRTHVHWVNDVIQLSHPLSSPSPPALNLSQHQDHFQWVGSSHQVTKVLEVHLQHQSFQWIFRFDFLWGWLVWSPCYPRYSQESSPAQFKSINSSLLGLLYGSILTSIHDYWKTGDRPPSLGLSLALSLPHTHGALGNCNGTSELPTGGLKPDLIKHTLLYGQSDVSAF